MGSRTPNLEGDDREGRASRPPYSGVLDPKTLEYRRIGPDLTATFFYRHISDKNFFLVVYRPPQLSG